MIPSRWWSQYKSRWLAKQEAALRQEYAARLQPLQDHLQLEFAALQQRADQLLVKKQELERLEQQLQGIEQQLQDRQVEAARANDELRTQLRLLEAKAAPDRVWVEAFSRGFEKAWDCLWDLQRQALLKLTAHTEQQAIESTLQRLDATITQRAEALGHRHVRELQALLAKRTEFEDKQRSATLDAEKVRYGHYLQALEWILDAPCLHSDQDGSSSDRNQPANQHSH